MPPLSCWKSSRSFVSGQSSKARSLRTVIEIWHPQPCAASKKGRGRWWLSGGMEEGLEMIGTEPVSELWPSNSSICTPLPFPLPFSPASLYTHTDMHTYTRARARAHTHAHTHRVEFSHLSSHLKSLSLALSLSLSHTHTHRIFHTFLLKSTELYILILVYSSVLKSHPLTHAHSSLLRHQSMLKIAWPETHLTTPLLSPSSATCPPLHNHYKQATVSSFSSNKGWAVTFVCISRSLVNS